LYVVHEKYIVGAKCKRIMKLSPFDLLERLAREYRVKILLTIYEVGEIEASKLAKMVGVYRSTIGGKIEELEGWGLIESEYVVDEKQRVVKRKVRLTEKGLKIAEKLKEILKLLNSGESEGKS